MASYEDKLEEELFVKILRLFEIHGKMSKIKATSGEHDEKLYATAEWQDLWDQSMELLVEIESLLIDTKYIPLTGIPTELITILEELRNSSDANIDEYIEQHLDTRLFKLKEDMKERVARIKTIFISEYLDPHTCRIYNEVIRCYIYGAFDASCVLCRAIAETIAKRFIEYKGYGGLLVGKNKISKYMSIQETLGEKLGIPEEIIKLYSKIASKADKILHKRDEKAEEEDARKAIELLQSFIQKFPRVL